MTPSSPRHTVYLGLGSNQGDRRDNLRRAVEFLAEHSQITIEARSPLYASQSVEGGGERDFLNAALRLTTTLSAGQLLGVCQEIEHQLGRPAPPRTGSRSVDVDILLFDDERYDTPDLMIPHPRALGRAFVMRPLLDVLEGGWVRPAAETW